MSYKTIDRGLLEIFGPTGFSLAVFKAAHLLHKFQTGSLYHYTLVILTAVTLILSLRKFWIMFEYILDYRGLILTIVIAVFLTK